MTINFLKDIGEFHDKFQVTRSKEPKLLSPEFLDFRIKFMQEELDEFKNSTTLEDQLDALIDLCYVLLGTSDIMGLPFSEGWSLVHQANMKKVKATLASQSKRNSSFDIIKPEGWVAPDLKPLIEKARINALNVEKHNT